MPKDSVLSIFLLALIVAFYSWHCTVTDAFLTSWFDTSGLHQKKYWYISQSSTEKQMLKAKEELIAKEETRAHKWKQRRRKGIDCFFRGSWSSDCLVKHQTVHCTLTVCSIPVWWPWLFPSQTGEFFLFCTNNIIFLFLYAQTKYSSTAQALSCTHCLGP